MKVIEPEHEEHLPLTYFYSTNIYVHNSFWWVAYVPLTRFSYTSLEEIRAWFSFSVLWYHWKFGKKFPTNSKTRQIQTRNNNPNLQFKNIQNFSHWKQHWIRVFIKYIILHFFVFYEIDLKDVRNNLQAQITVSRWVSWQLYTLWSQPPI